MDPNVEKLLDDAGLTGDERASALAAFSNDKLQKTLAQGVLRQGDYSRKMDAWSAEKKQYETNWAKANADFLQMQNDLGSTQSERDEAARKLAEAETKLASSQVLPNPITPVTPADAPKYLTAEDQGRFAAAQTAYFGDTLEVLHEHQQLFKVPLNGKQLIQEAMQAKKSPKDYWSEKYQVEAKRGEIAAAEKAESERQIREDERKKVTGEFLNPATRPLADSNSPFWTSTGEAPKNPWDDNAPDPTETALVASLASAGR